MLVQSIEQARQSAHVVVLGNEKGGSGKSTTALHIAVALLKAGQRVATVDLDSRQKSFTHYIENARASSLTCRRITASSAAKAIRWKPTRRRSSPTSRRRSARSSTATTWW